MPPCALTEPNYNAEPEPPTCPTRFYPPPPPPPPRNWGCKTALRLTALVLLLAALAVVAGGLLGAPHAGEASSHWVDYDEDNDGLIEITTLSQLNAIRWDPDGDGDVAAGNAANYLTAFPSRDTNSATRMGCPTGNCSGYELMNNLDFDENDDDQITSADTTYWNSGAGWNPIGGHVAASPQPSFTAAFEGNNHTISNLYINLNTSGDDDGRYVGLFANIGSSGTIRNLGLVNPYVKNTRSGAGTLIYYGALAGLSSSPVSRAYVDGGQVTGGQTNTGTNLNYAGCLVGRNEGTVSDSYATCDAAAIGGAWGTDRRPGRVGQ